MDIAKLISRPVTEPEFSAAFCRRCRLMGFITLEDILAETPEDLLSRTGMSLEWLDELIRFLGERELLHLLQSIPGKSPGRSG